jgi:hypothetical protein
MTLTRAHDGLFDHCSNLFGSLPPDIRRRLEAVIADPVTYWDDTHSIILRGTGKWLTLWQAVIHVDPSFPKVGPCTTEDGTCSKGWKQYPSRDTILRAILFAAEGRS